MKGRVGSDDPSRQHVARPAGDDRPPAPRDPAVTSGVTAAPGFVAGGLACGIKESGDPDLALVATDDARARRRGRRCSRRTSRRPRRCRSRARHLADGRAAAVVLSSGNANAATGEPGRRDALRMCELTGARPRRRDRRRARVLDRPHRHPDADGRARVGHPEALRRARAPTAAADAARAMLTTDTVRKEAVAHAGARDRRRHGEGRGDALARDGHDARGAHHRRRGRPRRAATGARARGERDASTASASTAAAPPTTPCWCSPTAGPARSTRTRSPTRSPRCAVRSPSRWRATPKVRRSSCASGSSAPARRPRRGSRPRAVANSQLVQCSLNGDDPYWGRVLSELGASGAYLDPERGRHLLQRRHRVPRRHRVRARRGRARGAHGRPRDRDPLRSAPGARRGDRAHHRPLARVHRREPAHVVTRRSATIDDRGCTTAGEKAIILAEALPYIREFSGKTVVIKYGGHAMDERRRSPSCSRPTSCSCGSSG